MGFKEFKTLVQRAREEPEFFHRLVFEPEAVISELEIPRHAKGALVAIEPGEVIARLVGVVAACGNTCTSSCDNTCGGSCGYTTNLVERPGEFASQYYARLRSDVAECGNTCTSSCDNTCGGSCGYTTNFAGRFSQGWAQ